MTEFCDQIAIVVDSMGIQQGIVPHPSHPISVGTEIVVPQPLWRPVDTWIGPSDLITINRIEVRL